MHTHGVRAAAGPIRMLLIGPYDPHCGEYTFLAPPLGVWRLAGVLRGAGVVCQVFDPNCCDGSVESDFERVLAHRDWDLIGVSTTGMTLRHDLALAHRARRACPEAVLVAGGMEATFDPGPCLRLGGFDLVVLGEGERPLRELARRILLGADLDSVPGTVSLGEDGELRRFSQPVLSREELRDATFATPYEDMPYSRYWKRLEQSYRLEELPTKADREARLSELRAVRLNTLNYCPMNCSFCSSTNFLHAAQGGATAKIARLDADECLQMIDRIVQAHPEVRTVIFQDDIFCFTSDQRILPLCDGIVEAKRQGRIPEALSFISTNRIDSMTPERLQAMRRAGFRVLGFGIESFARPILEEFNKVRIHPHIASVLDSALSLGITPFLDMILTSPRCRLEDLAENVSQAYRWLDRGCEVGMYPYVIPFSGAQMAMDPSLREHTVYAEHAIDGTGIRFQQPAKILPVDAAVRQAILEIEADFESMALELRRSTAHLPSRFRSLLWIAASIPVLSRAGVATPELERVEQLLRQRLPASLRPERLPGPARTEG